MKREYVRIRERIMGKPAGQFLPLALVITALSLILAACAPATAPAAPAAEPVATAAPAATATSAPQPTAAPAATATSAPQPTAAPVATATSAPKPTEKPAATAAPAATERPAATATPTPAAAQPAGVSYAKDVLPIFQQNCVKCHGGEKTEASLVLKDYAGVTAGSENGPVVKPGSAADSELVKLVAQGKMPKRGNRLSDSQVKILTDWVNAGAPNN